MSDKVEQLQRDVRYLMDRQQILDCIARHARGHDRHDVDLLQAAYHENGIDEHGHAINPGPKYAQWANAVHAAGSRLHTHNITTHICEIDGECVAHFALGSRRNSRGVTPYFLPNAREKLVQSLNPALRIRRKGSAVPAGLQVGLGDPRHTSFLSWPR